MSKLIISKESIPKTDSPFYAAIFNSLQKNHIKTVFNYRGINQPKLDNHTYLQTWGAYNSDRGLNLGDAFSLTSKLKEKHLVDVDLGNAPTLEKSLAKWEFLELFDLSRTVQDKRIARLEYLKGNLSEQDGVRFKTNEIVHVILGPIGNDLLDNLKPGYVPMDEILPYIDAIIKAF